MVSWCNQHTTHCPATPSNKLACVVDSEAKEMSTKANQMSLIPLLQFLYRKHIPL